MTLFEFLQRICWAINVGVGTGLAAGIVALPFIMIHHLIILPLREARADRRARKTLLLKQGKQNV